jgi:hypothetical protein
VEQSEIIKEYLIQNGIDPNELNNVKVPKVLDDFGKTLATTLENDSQIGEMFTQAMQVIEDLGKEIVFLEARITALEGGK